MVCVCGAWAGSDQEVWIKISPSTLALDSQAEWMTIHTNIPYGAEVFESLELSGIDVSWTKRDNRGYLVAKFDIDLVKDLARSIVGVEDGEVELTFSGELKDGTAFSASEFINVVVK